MTGARLGWSIRDAVISAALLPSVMRTTHTRPVRFSQEFMLLQAELARLSGQPVVGFNMVCGLYITGPLDTACLQAALNAVVRKHDAFRMAMHPNIEPSMPDRIRQLIEFSQTRRFQSGLYIHEVVDSTPVSLVCRAATWSEPEDIWELLDSEIREPFDNSRPPFLRATLLSTDARTHVLVITLSHLVADWWSLDVLRRDLLAHYRACASGRPVASPPVEMQFPAFVVEESAGLLSEASQRSIAACAATWLEYANCQVRYSKFEADHAGLDPSAQRSVTCTLPIDQPTCDRLSAMARQSKVTPSMVLRACVSIVLHEMTGQSRLAIPGNFANRDRRTANAIGWFANRHIVTSDYDETCSGDAYLKQVRARTIEAKRHEAVSLMAVWNALGRRIDNEPDNIWFTFDYFSKPETIDVSPELVVRPMATPHGRLARPDLYLRVHEVDRTFLLVIIYAAARYSGKTIARFIARLQSTIHAISISPHDSIASWRR